MCSPPTPTRYHEESCSQRNRQNLSHRSGRTNTIVATTMRMPPHPHMGRAARACASHAPLSTPLQHCNKTKQLEERNNTAKSRRGRQQAPRRKNTEAADRGSAMQRWHSARRASNKTGTNNARHHTRWPATLAASKTAGVQARGRHSNRRYSTMADDVLLPLKVSYTMSNTGARPSPRFTTELLNAVNARCTPCGRSAGRFIICRGTSVS